MIKKGFKNMKRCNKKRALKNIFFDLSDPNRCNVKCKQ